MTTASKDFRLEPATFADLKGWGDDDPSSLFRAMRDCRTHVRDVKPYRTGAAGLTADDLLTLLDDAEGYEPRDAAKARAFFEERCQPFFIRRGDGGRGFVTAFFEPEITVSATPDEIYRYPFYRRPDDLVDLDDANRPSGLDPSYMFGKLKDGAISAYPDRGEIDRGYLEGGGLEIAWAKSKVDVFFVHVQGAARLRYPDGRMGRITYAAKAGHPFSAVGRLLIERGLLDRATISMQTIRDWLYAHPQEVDEVLWHNRSYIFFREADVSDPALGPIAAAKVPLVAGRSLAVDRLIHTFGFPFFIQSESLTHLDAGQPFGRLMLALDTGSAIVGPARGDIFTGSGYDAGELAGTVRNDADFYILVPKAAAQRFG
ncbi:murein transglycosylase A [Agrobacterium rhizogenes]|uniref:peptidoglycan lytic exotransglycosylase n=1 Tax=Rhizobium rhizogenes (strain K84 / ATCC BAA-868) TaxID=311403 RepID=B9JG31_RHIR8|nr:murein transglycosylase A [Rhizobium rhizogenes]ACM24814.1 lytic murein transglycosylase A protein [Rhizobium rhizogenes K84]OCI91514.1 transglycosylase [Agrobacterium sp. 13-626]NTF83101.1 murein transglycosylase A [Rhizobium rhizogenes]NTG09452.1 murein transglycosylase A [Rhizobium rhizogenes]NTG36355.1 murein transglycosylase A [Rhizobium rhizogenes]